MPLQRCQSRVLTAHFPDLASLILNPNLINLAEDSIEAVLGTKFLRNGTEECRQRIRVAKVIVHEKYHPVTLAHNIALLKLEEPADLSSKVAPICLGMEDAIAAATTATAIGWSKLGDGDATETLQEAELAIVPQEECGKQDSLLSIAEDVVCAGAEGQGACQSDTGGCLVAAGSDGASHLLGTYVGGCGRASYSGVVVRVSEAAEADLSAGLCQRFCSSWKNKPDELPELDRGKISEDDWCHGRTFPPPPLPLPSKPKNCECGVANLSDRIAGDVTIPHTYPWQVALVERLKMIPYCGGALVSDLWVLTSCTCTLRTPLDHQVLLGLHDWTIDNAVGLVRRDIAQIVMHPLYGLVALGNDIALLKLSSPVPLDQVYIAPVCLPALGQKIDDGVAVVTGWGPLEYGKRDGGRGFKLKDRVGEGVTQIRHGLTDRGGKGARQGSPLVMDNGRGNYVLIGIASWGLTSALPGVYVNVASKYLWEGPRGHSPHTFVTDYADWISDIIVGSETCAAH
ncbi:transmembrane protease serine 9-like [Penaeus japonicus]|uniref:transmembrane protease serine 9-like n=1 Tax=Penaeus japonicus TaxID=27405 RepID=UPI001C715940|nr:transmembrane protease serine 9-like [Penaeus japonicus]